MVASMTGFARHRFDLAGHTLIWELRSVNHRHLDLRVLLPDAFRPAEMAVRKQLQSRLGRGRIEAQLMRESPDVETRIDFDREQVRGIVTTLREIDQMMVNGARVSAMEILRWPGVMQRDLPEPDEAILAALLAGLDGAIDGLQIMRRGEGAHLRHSVLSRLEQVAEQLPALRARRKSILAEQKDRLQVRVAELGVNLEPQRLAQEIALLAQRLDIEEELDRLSGHVAAVRDGLETEEPVGRRLDFLMQEFNREANTIGSKSNDLETVQCVVEIKVLIEQMREQIQNIE